MDTVPALSEVSHDSGQRCPSVPARVGVDLIGVAQPDGRVGFLSTPMRIDQAFLDIARNYGPTGDRFRFSASCEQGRCVHWTDSECGLINRLRQRVDAVSLVPDLERLPSCGIRDACRWWAQHGASACKICVLVATDQANSPATSCRISDLEPRPTRDEYV